MKLVVCHACSDLFALRREWQECACGKTGGQYTDGLRAVVRGPGGGFSCLGIDNPSLVAAIRAQRDEGDLPPAPEFGGHPPGRRFEAFVLPDDCPSLRKEVR